MAFLEAILSNVENGVLVCLKVLDMYLPAVFVVEKCQGMTKFGPRDNEQYHHL